MKLEDFRKARDLIRNASVDPEDVKIVICSECHDEYVKKGGIPKRHQQCTAGLMYAESVAQSQIKG